MINSSAISSKAEVEELKKHQKRASAIETLLTTALVTFGYLQVIIVIFTTDFFYEDGLPLILGIFLTGMYFLAIYLTMLIGGRNLREVLAEETGFVYKNKE